MDAETERRIEETVLGILEEADMESVTEYKVRKMAAEKLGLDLSIPDRKRFVRRVVESFLVSKSAEPQESKEEDHAQQAQQQNDEQEEGQEEMDTKRGREERQYEYDDDGDLIICRLSNKRRVTIQDFKGKTLVSIREFYEKDGKQLPTSKGISLTVEQWETFRDSVPAIEDAIKQLED